MAHAIAASGSFRSTSPEPGSRCGYKLQQQCDFSETVSLLLWIIPAHRFHRDYFVSSKLFLTRVADDILHLSFSAVSIHLRRQMFQNAE